MAACPPDPERLRRVREMTENPANFLSSGGSRESREDPSLKPPIAPLSGRVYAMVHKDHAAEPLRDPDASISTCERHLHSAEAPAGESPCLFEAVSFAIAASPEELLHSICAAMLRGAPYLSLDWVIRSLDRDWRIVPLDANRVNLAALAVGPPLIQRKTRLRRNNRAPTEDREGKARAREALDRGAALATTPADPNEFGSVERLLIFTIPGQALMSVGALRWGSPQKFSDLPFNRSRLRVAKTYMALLGEVSRENRHAIRAVRRKRRDTRRHESAERWRVRGLIASEMRSIPALIREWAEALVALAKAALLFVFLITGLSTVMTLLCEFVRSRWP